MSTNARHEQRAHGVRRPHGALLGALVALCLALPVLGVLGVTEVGSYRMFSAPHGYRVRLWTLSDRGVARPLSRAELAPHLGRDAQRVVHLGADFRLGETNVTLLANGLDDLGRLACALRRDAVRADVLLEVRPLSAPGEPGDLGEAGDSASITQTFVRVPCR